MNPADSNDLLNFQFLTRNFSTVVAALTAILFSVQKPATPEVRTASKPQTEVVLRVSFFAIGPEDEEPRLTHEMFLGKPLVVHLPSRNQRIRVGGWQSEIRIPELSRIRYIH